MVWSKLGEVITLTHPRVLLLLIKVGRFLFNRALHHLIFERYSPLVIHQGAMGVYKVRNAHMSEATRPRLSSALCVEQMAPRLQELEVPLPDLFL